MLDTKFEQAIRLLAEHLPFSSENTRKPILPHSLRVGVYLNNHNYKEKIIIAGLLHDILENTNIEEEKIKENFGQNVLELIKANSKNLEIKKEERNEEMIKRCAEHSEEALIIKAADTIDSYNYYQKVNNQDQLENHCKVIAELIFKYKPENFKDQIFIELSKILKT